MIGKCTAKIQCGNHDLGLLEGVNDIPDVVRQDMVWQPSRRRVWVRRTDGDMQWEPRVEYEFQCRSCGMKVWLQMADNTEPE